MVEHREGARLAAGDAQLGQRSGMSLQPGRFDRCRQRLRERYDPSQPRPRRAAGSRRLDTTLLHGQALISVISALASFIDGVFEMLRELPRVRRDHKRKRILREMLEDPRYQWRGIGTLARSIGSSEDDARELLVSIGARASTGAGDELWGLRSRVGAG